MNLYVDEDRAKASLIRLLRSVGHRATVPADVGLAGAADPRQLMHAVHQNLTLLSRNHDDFEDLHLLIQATAGKHPGLLVIRSDNDPGRDMKDRDIAPSDRES